LQNWALGNEDIRNEQVSGLVADFNGSFDETYASLSPSHFCPCTHAHIHLAPPPNTNKDESDSSLRRGFDARKVDEFGDSVMLAGRVDRRVLHIKGVM
jgi:hypothetical protein